MSEMTAPDRIYAHEAIDNGPCDGWDFEGTWHVDEGANGGVEYIRSDLHATLQAENERLRHCRESLATLLVLANGVELRDEMLRRYVVRLARAALK